MMCLLLMAVFRQSYAPGPATGDQLLQQALMEEAAKAAKNGLIADPFSGVQFKEVRALCTCVCLSP